MGRSTIFACWTLIAVALVSGRADDWNRFLGPNGTAHAPHSVLPVQWSEGQNIRWQTDLPGKGSSCPIVVGDQVLLTCYSGYGMDRQNPGNPADLVRHLISFDPQTGKQNWKSDVSASGDEDPYKGFIAEHGYASSTPTSDGKQIFAFFGKTGLVAFDMQGKQQWRKDLGQFSDPFKWGDGSSPILYKDSVIVFAGIVGHSIVALKKENGDVIWKVENPDFTNTWSTPILVDVDQHQELVFSVPGSVFALDPDTGDRLWQAESPITNTVCPSLAQHQGVVFAMGGRGGLGIAVRCGGKGDVTKTHLVWQAPVRAGISTPVVADGNLMWSSGGFLYCVSCETGQEVYRQRVGGQEAGGRQGPAGDYASPVQCGEQVIIVNRNGQAQIVAAGNEYKLLGSGSFADDPGLFNASPAISGNAMFIRSDNRLYCIAEK